MKCLAFLFVLAMGITCNSRSQTTLEKQEANKQVPAIVGGSCEGCEAIYESPVAFVNLNPVDTLADFNEAGSKIEISGTIYNADGKTPAANVVLYIYHTNQQGRYFSKGTGTGWGKRHGYLRGWIKTDSNGLYKFFTLVPASYPNSSNPKHIHPVVKEPGINEYYIDEFLFDNDPFLTEKERKKTDPRGGSGIVKPFIKNGMLRATRNIILGLNVPGYHAVKQAPLQSGLAVGEDCPAFDPIHLSGADNGKTACPMCKYGSGQGLMIWFNHIDLSQLKALATRLEGEMKVRGEKRLRVFLVYMNPSYNMNDGGTDKKLREQLKQWCIEQHLQKVAMVWVPSPVDKETCGVYNINPKVKNTVFAYKERKVVAKWIDINYDDQNMNNMLNMLNGL